MNFYYFSSVCLRKVQNLQLSGPHGMQVKSGRPMLSSVGLTSEEKEVLAEPP